MLKEKFNEVISFMDIKSLIELKQRLIKNKLSQKAFEDYLSNNPFEEDMHLFPMYSINYNGGQVITNNQSLYCFNEKYFKITEKILKYFSYEHRSIPMNSEETKNYLLYVEKYLKNKIEHFTIDTIDSNNHVIAKTESKKYKFKEFEYNTACILLDNPKFKLYDNLLYGESNKGKVYILGCNNN